MAGAKTEKASMRPKNTKLHDGVPVVEYEPPLRGASQCTSFFAVVASLLSRTHAYLSRSLSIARTQSLACLLSCLVCTTAHDLVTMRLIELYDPLLWLRAASLSC